MPDLKMMKLATLEELMACAESFALGCMKTSGTCRPCLFFTDPGGQPGIFMFANGEFDEGQKDHFRDTARLVCIAEAAVACVFVSEIWCSVGMVKPGENAAATQKRVVAEKGMPSEDFERREMIMFAGEARDRRICKVLPIVRSGNGKFWNFGESEFPPMDTSKGDNYEGRFAHILPTKEAPAQMRELAKLALMMQGMKPMVVPMPMKKRGGGI